MERQKYFPWRMCMVMTPEKTASPWKARLQGMVGRQASLRGGVGYLYASVLPDLVANWGRTLIIRTVF
jgi:hypothetical protein